MGRTCRLCGKENVFHKGWDSICSPCEKKEDNELLESLYGEEENELSEPVAVENKLREENRELRENNMELHKENRELLARLAILETELKKWRNTETPRTKKRKRKAAHLVFDLTS